ncbi:ABC transporter permease [Glaciihabitans sp. dw_435]|uniref:ABC transporter permease n=1 Tax=Glaciihabitans sp. dw_435 TaxID=2720081 RepID=UPI001BD1E2F9|nr:ABC transporter permease [Glaciihabitans sp. dw_435]
MDILNWIVSASGEGFFSATMRLAVPLLLAAIGAIYAERAGAINVGLEGMMLSSALSAALVASSTGSTTTGLLAGVVTGVGVAALLAIFTVLLPADPVVVGISLNLLAVGGTSFIFRVAVGQAGTTSTTPVIEASPIPGLDQIPILGPLLFDQSYLVYIALLGVVVTWLVLKYTGWGLLIRSAGEHPAAVDSLGLSVNRTRFLALLVSGGFAGLGGAFLSLVASNQFVENMTAGRGYIAMAILILGQRSPWGVLIASLIFGAGDAFQLRAQLDNTGIPFQFLLMIPYVLTIVTLAVFGRKLIDPAALGKHFRRGHR